MNCEYSFIDPRHDGVDNFIRSVSHYSKNTECSLAQAFWELSLYAYKWLLSHFDKRKSHRIHRNVICHSLFWVAFAKAYWDRSKPGHHKYDAEKMARNVAEGRTIMIRVGDPIDYEGKVFATLGQLFWWRTPSDFGCGHPMPPRLHETRGRDPHPLNETGSR